MAKAGRTVAGRQKKTSTRRATMIGITFVVLVLFVSMLVLTSSLHKKVEADALKKAAKEKTALHADTDKKETFAVMSEDKELFLENPNSAEHLNDVRNVLIMTNNQAYSSKGEWVDALAATNYDMIAIDPFFRFNRPLSAQDVRRLKYKKLGSKRLVFAVLNLSVAEDTRPYWDLTWKLKSRIGCASRRKATKPASRSIIGTPNGKKSSAFISRKSLLWATTAFI